MVNRPKATPDQIKKMVNNLESFRYIWDVNMQDFFNRQKKQAEWAQLAEIVGLPLADTKEHMKLSGKNSDRWVFTDGIEMDNECYF